LLSFVVYSNEERKFVYCLFVVYSTVCGINYCLFGGKTLYTVSLLYIQRFAEMIAVFYCIVAKKIR